MKLKRLFIAGAFIVISSACWTADEKALTSPQYLPVVSLDFTDLDARDAQNRPVFDDLSVGELVVLFRQNAMELLLQNAGHAQQIIQALVASFSYLFDGLFIKSTVDQIQRFIPAFVNTIRRVVHNVDNLWTTSSVGTPAAGRYGASFSLSRKPQKLYLRC